MVAHTVFGGGAKSPEWESPAFSAKSSCHIDNDCLWMLALFRYSLSVSDERLDIKAYSIFGHCYGFLQCLSLCHTSREGRYSNCISSLLKVWVQNDSVLVFPHCLTSQIQSKSRNSSTVSPAWSKTVSNVFGLMITLTCIAWLPLCRTISQP